MMSIKHYTDPELLEINTLENAIYMAMQNDVSFMIGLRLSLYEHQSTFNPNLPLRYLFYISDLYSGMIDKNKLYGSRKILFRRNSSSFIMGSRISRTAGSYDYPIYIPYGINTAN